MATRNLTFKSTDLGDNVTLMLCFTPPLPKLYVDQFPIAWKVTTLAARGRSSLHATWSSDLGFSATQMGGSLVTAGNYTPIKAGQTTSLVYDQTVQPPVQYWTDPKDRPGVTTVQAINRTGGPAGIGIGFITDLNKPTEDMNVALAWPNVGNTLAVVGELTPVLSAYIALNYQETQIVRGEIQSRDPIWKKNLMSLHPNTTIVISKDATGAYIATETKSKVAAEAFELNLVRTAVAISPPIVPEKFTRVFRATLSFAARDLVDQSLKTIAEYLQSKSYRVSATIQDGKATDAIIELILPPSTSCNQAEKDVLGCIEDDGMPTHTVMKERSGELMVYSKDRVSFWEDINPAKSDWNYRENIVPHVKGPDSAKTQNIENGNVFKEILNGLEEIGEAPSKTANGSPGLLGSELTPAPVNYGKTRTIGRKASSVYLQA